MTKVSSEIAYAVSTELSPGVWDDVITKKTYYAEVVRDARRWVTEQQVNDSLLINNRLSIIADSFAHANFSFMKYVKFEGVWWEISNIEIARPRLILTLGSVHNGPTS